MFGLGIFEILFIAVLALLLIGPEQLPEVTRTLARFLVDLRRSTNALKSDFQAHASANLLKLEEDRKQILEGDLQAQPEVDESISQPQQLELGLQLENGNHSHHENESESEWKKSSGENGENVE